MRIWSAKEVAMHDLTTYLNNLEQSGAQIFAVLDGSGSRTGYCTVISHTTRAA